MKKGWIVGWLLGGIVLCVVIWLIASRWNVWFGNAPEPIYSTPNIPHHILLTMGDDENSRLLTWQCDTMLQEAFVEYGCVNADDSVAICDKLNKAMATATKYVSQGGASVFYKTEITTPLPGKYVYRINHPNVQSQWYEFAVSDANDSIVRFVFVGDIQDSINGVTSDITEQIVQRHPDREFYMLGGDLIHRPQEQYWNELFRGISPFATSYPVMAVSGNHEYLKGIYNICEARFPLHFAYFDENYSHNDYCFETLKYDNVELFMLDSHCDILRLIKQCEQLKQALSESTATWKIVVLHHPPYSIRRKTNNIHLRWLLTPILEKYAVDLVLSGHEHGYARIVSHKGDDNSMPVYTISHCSPKVYSHHNTEVGVYDNREKYYQCIDCTADTLFMYTYTSAGNIIDEVIRTKQNGKTTIL